MASVWVQFAGKTWLRGAGFFADAFDLFNINVVKNVMAAVYPQSADQASMLSSSALIGSVAGMLVFGALADIVGRRAVFITTITLLIVGALGSVTCVDTEAVSIYTQLCLWRLVLGFGIGGEYPLSATVTRESKDNLPISRGKRLASVFALQGLGNVAACLVSYLSLLTLADDVAWRVILGAGALPGLVTVYWRWQQHESADFQQAAGATSQVVPRSSTSLLRDVEHGSGNDKGVVVAKGDTRRANGQSNSDKGGHDGSTRSLGVGSPLLQAHDMPPLRTRLTRMWTVIAEHKWTLMGTAGSWFLFDIVFYANGLFTASALAALGFGGAAGSGHHSRDALRQLALGSLYITLIGLPGYFMALSLIDRIGRRAIQLLGFTALLVVFGLLAAVLPQLEHVKLLFVLLYGMTFFFANFGPNTSTYVIPAEAFPTAARAVCHGVSAASGKFGAVIGAAAMAPLLDAWGTSQAEKQDGLRAVLAICATLSALSALWTYAFTKETRDIPDNNLAK